MPLDRVGVRRLCLYIHRNIVKIWNEEREKTTEPMDRWGCVNRAWGRITSMLDDLKARKAFYQYSVNWDGADAITVILQKFKHNSPKLFMRVMLNEEEE